MPLLVTDSVQAPPPYPGHPAEDVRRPAAPRGRRADAAPLLCIGLESDSKTKDFNPGGGAVVALPGVTSGVLRGSHRKGEQQGAQEEERP